MFKCLSNPLYLNLSQYYLFNMLGDLDCRVV